jgi:hypothetical protein
LSGGAGSRHAGVDLSPLRGASRDLFTWKRLKGAPTLHVDELINHRIKMLNQKRRGTHGVLYPLSESRTVSNFNTYQVFPTSLLNTLNIATATTTLSLGHSQYALRDPLHKHCIRIQEGQQSFILSSSSALLVEAATLVFCDRSRETVPLPIV